MTIAVVTDSSCDLPIPLAERHAIAVVPLTIRFGDEEFVDRDELSVEEFWKRFTTSSVIPQTAAPAPGRFVQAFQSAKESGATGIICLTLTSKLSGTYQSALVAASQVPDIPIKVIDTLSLTTALGAQCVYAAQMASEGADLDSIFAALTAILPRTRIFATLDTLEYLRKGGRIGAAGALIGTLLNIKPVISIVDGVVHPASKQRTRQRALDYLFEQLKSSNNPQQITVCHALAEDYVGFIDRVREAFPNSEILESTIGPVIGTYGGPGVLGVTFVDSIA